MPENEPVPVDAKITHESHDHPHEAVDTQRTGVEAQLDQVDGHRCNAHCNHAESVELAQDTFSTLTEQSLLSHTETRLEPVTAKSPETHHHGEHICDSHCSHHEATELADELLSNHEKTAQLSSVTHESDHKYTHDVGNKETPSPTKHSHESPVNSTANSSESISSTMHDEASDGENSGTEINNADQVSIETGDAQGLDDSKEASKEQRTETTAKQPSAEQNLSPTTEKHPLKSTTSKERIEEPTSQPMTETKKPSAEQAKPVTTQAEVTVPTVTAQVEQDAVAEPEAIATPEVSTINHVAESADEVTIDDQPEFIPETEFTQPVEATPSEEIVDLFSQAEALTGDDEQAGNSLEVAPTSTENKSEEITVPGETAELEETELDVEAILAEIADLQNESDTLSPESEMNDPSTPPEVMPEAVEAITNSGNESKDSTVEQGDEQTELSPIEQQLETKVAEALASVISPEVETVTRETALEVVERLHLSVSEAQLDKLLEYLRDGTDQQTYEYITGLLKLKHVEFQQEFLTSTKQSLMKQIAQRHLRLISLLRKFLPRLLVPTPD